MYSCTGLELIFNLTEWEQQTIWSTLKGEPSTKAPSLSVMLSRAYAKPEKQYEIYIWETSHSLEEITIMFQTESTREYILTKIHKYGKEVYAHALHHG